MDTLIHTLQCIRFVSENFVDNFIKKKILSIKYSLKIIYIYIYIYIYMEVKSENESDMKEKTKKQSKQKVMNLLWRKINVKTSRF